VSSPAAPTGKPDRRHPVVAFLQHKRKAVMVADAAGRTWKAADIQPGESSLGQAQLPTQFAWSPDASRLAWIDPQEGGETGEIHFVDVRGGEQTTHPCPCSGIGFLGDDVVSLSGDGSSLLLFPPDGRPRRIALDERQRPSSSLEAGGTDDVILFSPLPEGPDVFRGQGTLAVADRRGKVRQLLPGKGRTTFHEARRQPGGQAVAWANSDSGGACWSVETVLTHRVTAGGADRSLPADAAFRHALVKQARLVTFLAWAGDGLTVTYSALNNCQVMYPERTASYYLRDGRWTYLGSGMLGIAFGAEGRAVRLEDPVYPKVPYAEAANPATGTLTLTAGGRKTVLGKGVSLFALTPAESAAARPPAAPADQPAAGVTAEDDHGARLPAAVAELARKIENAAARGDTDRLAELCDPCRAGHRDWIRSDDGMRAVLRAIRTHPMKVGDGVLMYPGWTSCVDEPRKELSCTPQQLRDAAVLRLKPQVTSEPGYGGSSYSSTDAVVVPLTLRIEGGTAQWTGLAAT
jgi:hypothetical protein